jgi:hypothetical protein
MILVFTLVTRVQPINKIINLQQGNRRTAALLVCGIPFAITSNAEGSWQTHLQIVCGSTYQTRNKPNVIFGCAMILELPSSAFWKRREGLLILGELPSGDACVRMRRHASPAFSVNPNGTNPSTIKCRSGNSLESILFVLAGGTDPHPTPPGCRTDVVPASLAKVLNTMISCKYRRIKQMIRGNHDN